MKDFAVSAMFYMGFISGFITLLKGVGIEVSIPKIFKTIKEYVNKRS